MHYAASVSSAPNPPINGFYEMMMGLTPERRKELRELARQHNEKQVAEKTEVKACLLYTSSPTW